MANTWQGEFPWQNLKLDKFEGTAPVSAFSPNGYGLYNMAGNVWEWVQDWYDESYYKKSPPQNPTGPSEGEARVIRGGSWQNTPDTLRSSNRNKHLPTERRVYIGIRCAKDAKDVKAAK